MLEDLKNEIENFFKDINENIKNEDDLNYIKIRTARLTNVIADEVEKIMNYKEDKLNAIIKKQEEGDKRLKELNEKIDAVYDEMYEDEMDNFLINCPYCNNEFDADIDEEFNEIRCPECGNIIELDWNGNPEDEPETGCGNNCSNCGGC